MEDRGDRRARTLRYSKRAQRIHLFFAHNQQFGVLTAAQCACELADWFFRKKKSHGCHCSKKRRGNPKICRGICFKGTRCSTQNRIADVARVGKLAVRETVKLRQEWRRQLHELKTDLG